MRPIGPRPKPIRGTDAPDFLFLVRSRDQHRACSGELDTRQRAVIVEDPNRLRTDRVSWRSGTAPSTGSRPSSPPARPSWMRLRALLEESQKGGRTLRQRQPDQRGSLPRGGIGPRELQCHAAPPQVVGRSDHPADSRLVVPRSPRRARQSFPKLRRWRGKLLAPSHAGRTAPR